MGLAERVHELESYRLPRWDDFPEFELYSEQLCGVVNDALEPLLRSERSLTPTMLHNYVKWDVIPRPVNRRYSREHIASLIVICILKTVIEIQDIRRGISLQSQLMPIREAYDLFAEELEAALGRTAPPFRSIEGPHDFPAFKADASRLAVIAVCEALSYRLTTLAVIENEGFLGPRIKKEGREK